jgi:hypothetical protein
LVAPGIVKFKQVVCGLEEGLCNTEGVHITDGDKGAIAVYYDVNKRIVIPVDVWASVIKTVLCKPTALVKEIIAVVCAINPSFILKNPLF